MKKSGGIFLVWGIFFVQCIFVASLFAAEKTPQDEACSSRLLGTMSKESCEANCPQGANVKCFQVEKYAPEATGLSEELECYTCARDQQCSDLGYLDWWGCFPCDANPKTECVKAGVTLPFGGGTIGGTTWSGTQCYQCVPKPDRCSDAFPGTTWLAACKANCAGPNKDCAFVGAYQGNDCYKCVEFNVETCGKFGLLEKAECQACEKDPTKKCVVGGMTKDFRLCYQCVGKNEPPQPPSKGCKELGLADQCDTCLKQQMGCLPTQAPNGQACYECVPRTQNYCPPPTLNKWECPICEERGGQCIGVTRTKNDPDCYNCYFGNREEISACARREMWDSCSPNPCFENQTCTMIQVEPGLSCAQCEDIPGYHEDQKCEQYNKYTTCAPCYEKQHGCRKVLVPEINEWCAECYLPYDAVGCADQEEQAFYQTVKTGDVTNEIAIVARPACSGCSGKTDEASTGSLFDVFFEVSILSRGPGGDGRNWVPEKPLIQSGKERIRPTSKEFYYVAKESIAKNAAIAIFTALGSQYERVAKDAAASEGKVCPVTGQKLEGGGVSERSDIGKAIDRAGMAAGMGLLTSQAKGQITGLRSSFCVPLQNNKDSIFKLTADIVNQNTGIRHTLNIPVIGMLFRRQNAQDEKRDLYIVVQPRMVDTDE